MARQRYIIPITHVCYPYQLWFRIFTDQLIAYDSYTDDLIPGATFAEQLKKPWNVFQEHRFDWIEGLTTFYADNVQELEMRKNVPTHVCSQLQFCIAVKRILTTCFENKQQGKIMLNVWADNGSWSG